MQQHLVADVVEQYVIGALDPESARFVEAHVAQCAACAARLQQEAVLEVGLHEVAARSAVVSLATRRRRLGVVVASAAAAVLAAGVLVGVLFRTLPSAHGQPTLRRCADAQTASDCISQAQFDGVITLDPAGQPVVPRYELVPGGQP